MLDGIIMKYHGGGDRGVLALCDKDILGKTLIEDDIEFKVTKGFYAGDPVNKDTLLGIISMVGSINAVGKISIGILLEEGIAREEDIIYIQDVPHIQIYNM